MLSRGTTPLIVWVSAKDPKVELPAAVHIIEPLLLCFRNRVREGLHSLKVRIPTILAA